MSARRSGGKPHTGSVASDAENPFLTRSEGSLQGVGISGGCITQHVTITGSALNISGHGGAQFRSVREPIVEYKSELNPLSSVAEPPAYVRGTEATRRVDSSESEACKGAQARGSPEVSKGSAAVPGGATSNGDARRLQKKRHYATRRKSHDNKVQDSLIAEIEKLEGEMDALLETDLDDVDPAPYKEVERVNPTFPLDTNRFAPLFAKDEQWELVKDDVRLYHLNSDGSVEAAQAIMGKMRLVTQRHGVNKTPGYALKARDVVREVYAENPQLFEPFSWARWLVEFHSFLKRPRPTLWFTFLVFSLLTALGILLSYIFSSLGLALSWFLLVQPLAVVTIVCVQKPWRDRFYAIFEAGGSIEDYCSVLHHNPAHCGKFKMTSDPRCRGKLVNVGFTIAKDYIWLPRNCSCNEERALLTRQLLPQIGTPIQRKDYWDRAVDCFLTTMRRDHSAFEYYIDPNEAVVSYREHLTAAQRRRYDLASRLLDAGCEWSSRTKGFVKREWLTGKSSKKRDPRFISGKTDEYLALVGPTYYHFQKQLVKAFFIGTDDELLRGRYLYPGGIDAVQLGRIVSHFEELGWHVYEGDFSRYDGHTEEEALRAEMELYRKFGLPASVIRYLSEQFYTTGTTMSGHTFSHVGKRSSGVINTTMGNTLCGFMMAALGMAEQGVQDYYVVQLGDDNIIFTREPIDMDMYIAAMRSFGHKLEMVYRGCDTDAYDSLEFCSSVFWDVGEHRVLGPKPFRALAKSFMPTVKLDQKGLSAHLGGVASSFKHYMWIPLLGNVCENFLKHHRVGRKWTPKNPYKLTLKHFVDVDPAAVSSHFYRRYGNTPEEFWQTFRGFDFTKPGSISSALLMEGMMVDGVFDQDSFD